MTKREYFNPLISINTRLYLYRLSFAIVTIFVGFTTWEAITLEQWSKLLEALFGIVVMGGNVVSHEYANKYNEGISPPTDDTH